MSTYENLTEQFLQKTYSGFLCGIDFLPAGKYKVHLKENVQPIVHPHRRISVALNQKIKEKLKTMEQEGLIVRQTEPKEWINNLLAVIKPNGRV